MLKKSMHYRGAEKPRTSTYKENIMFAEFKYRYKNFICDLDEQILDMRIARCHVDDYVGNWYYDKPTLKEQILTFITRRLPEWK